MDETSERERREKTLERQIRAFHWVRLLAELPRRTAGAAGEREAALRVEGFLRELGVEEISLPAVASRPRAGAVHALHLGLGVVACAAGGWLGLALAGLTALSLHRELRAGRPALSRMLGAPDSVNVAARVGPERPRRRIVLTAPLDAAQAGRIFAKPLVDLYARLARRLPALAGPSAVSERLLQAAILVTAASALGATGLPLAVARVVLGVLLGISALAALEWALARATPGANANASGVAAMLTCGEQLLTRLPDDVELWMVGTGAGEVGSCGMRAFLDDHRDWRGDRTWLLGFEGVGGGRLGYVRSEAGAARVVHPPMMRELARRVAESGAFGDVEPFDLVTGTDGRVAASRELHTLTLVSLESNGLPRLHHGADDVPENLEMETVIRAADFATAVVWAALRGEADPLAIV